MQTGHKDQKISRIEKPLTRVLSAFWLIYIISQLGRSLWIDESITYWISHAPLPELIQRSFHFQGNSPLFFLVERFFTSSFDSELILRLPCLLFGLGSAFLTFQIGKKLFDTATATLALLFLLSAPDFIASTVNARPYAMGLFFTLASINSLMSWLNCKRSRDLLIFAFSLALAILAHYFFAHFILVLLAVCLTNRNSISSSRDKVLLAGAFSISIAPIAIGFVQLSKLNQLTQFTFAALSFHQVLLSALQPQIFILGALVIWKCKKHFFSRTVFWRDLNFRPLMIIVLWYTIPPMTLYLAGVILHAPIYQTRYALPYVPGFALLCAFILTRYFTASERPAYIILLQLVSLIMTITHSQIIYEDWRKSASILRKQFEQGADYPVLVHSTLMESESAAWLLATHQSEYLLAPYSFYQIPQQKFSLPMNLFATNQAPYLEEIICPLISRYAQVLFVTRSGPAAVSHIEEWLRSQAFSTRLIWQSETVSVGEAIRMQASDLEKCKSSARSLQISGLLR